MAIEITTIEYTVSAEVYANYGADFDTEAVNDALSLRRAASIKRRLGAEMPEVLSRLRTQGMGAKQNIVGTGSDDVVDALDRRVEFAIIDCPA